MGAACGISLTFQTSEEPNLASKPSAGPSSAPAPPSEFTSVAEVENCLRAAESLTETAVSNAEKIFEASKEAISVARKFLSGLRADLGLRSDTRAQEELRIDSLVQVRESAEHKLWSLRNHQVMFRRACALVRNTAATRIFLLFQQARAAVGGLQKRVLLWKRQLLTVDTQIVQMQLGVLIEMQSVLGKKLAFMLTMPDELQVLGEFGECEEKLKVLQLLEDRDNNGEEIGDDAVFTEQVMLEESEESWQAQDFREMIVASEAMILSPSVGTPFSLPELPGLEDTLRNSAKTSTSDVTPTVLKSNTVTLCLAFDVRELLSQKELRVHAHDIDPRFESQLEIGAFYSESREIAAERASSKLSKFCATLKETQDEEWEREAASHVFAQIMLEKARFDEESAMRGDSQEDMDRFILRYCERNEIVFSLLTAIKLGVMSSDRTSRTIARIFNVFVEDQFPARVSLVIPRLMKFLPEYSIPSVESLEGRLKLADAIYFISKVFARLPVHGIELIRRIRPETLTSSELTLFLICFKINEMKLKSLFQQVVGDRERAPITLMGAFLRKKLHLWSSEEEVESALHSLDAAKKGFVSRMAFTSSFSVQRFHALASLPEYSVETMKFVSEFAEICVRWRREVVSKLAIVYRAVAGDGWVSRSAFVHLLEALDPGEVSSVQFEMREQYSFLDFLSVAERWLLGPFKSVYLIAQSPSRDAGQVL